MDAITKTRDVVLRVIEDTAPEFHEGLFDYKLSQLELDSIDFATLVFDIEDALGVEVSVDGIDPDMRVGDLIHHVESIVAQS